MSRRFIMTGIIALAILVGFLAITYEIVAIDWASFMEDQPIVDYGDGPRRLAPEGAIPVSRPTYLDEPSALQNPVPADAVSLQRGAILFDLHCSVCHGTAGKGDGPVVEFWRVDARRPADLSDPRIGAYPDGTIYRILQDGLGVMPPLRENLDERQRWDVINFVKTLQP
jgi:mono/diheme cytochrome c family protein